MVHYLYTWITAAYILLCLIRSLPRALENSSFKGSSRTSGHPTMKYSFKLLRKVINKIQSSKFYVTLCCLKMVLIGCARYWIDAFFFSVHINCLVFKKRSLSFLFASWIAITLYIYKQYIIFCIQLEIMLNFIIRNFSTITIVSS